VARRLRATDGGRRIALVALTGFGQAEDRRRAFAAGFDAHLTKPVAPDRLARTTSNSSDKGNCARLISVGIVSRLPAEGRIYPA
jgi:CheY-like chemotaxis protein